MKTKANIKHGKLICQCGAAEKPRLSEHGYTVTHNLSKLSGKEISAYGWDGDSNDISEQGTHYTLDCYQCCREYELPDGVEINWL